MGGGDQFQAQHICLSHRWQLPQWGASFFLLPKQKQGETSEDQSLRDATGPAWKPHHLWLRRAYRLGRSCRSFFTQGVSGFTQTLSRLFSLILENREELEQPSPPVLLTKGGTEIIQGGWGEQRACTPPPPRSTYTTSRRRQLLPTGRTSMLLYFHGGMKALVVLAQRQLRLPLASRRAGWAHSLHIT